MTTHLDDPLEARSDALPPRGALPLSSIELSPSPAPSLSVVQAKAGKKRRELQRQVLFTMPIRPKAGQSVRVYYNPDVTTLRGRPEAWLRGGWNR